MTPKEKAVELINEMYYARDEDGFHSVNKCRAKHCALIAVGKILEVISEYSVEPIIFDIDYWQEVKQEIIWRN